MTDTEIVEIDDLETSAKHTVTPDQMNLKTDATNFVQDIEKFSVGTKSGVLIVKSLRTGKSKSISLKPNTVLRNASIKQFDVDKGNLVRKYSDIDTK